MDHVIGGQQTFFIVASVLMFVFLVIAILIIIDHKARIPGELQNDPFSITGMRHNHPVLSFVTALLLFIVILALLAELTLTFGEKFGLLGEKKDKRPEILQQLRLERFSEKQRHFHNVPVKDVVNSGKKTVCFSCHGDYPHSKKEMVRTLLNMHTQFVGCMTCHTSPDKIPEEKYTFEWLNFSGIDVKGVPFGTKNNPRTGYLVETDDYYSKIVISELGPSGSRLIEIIEDLPEVLEFLAVKDTLSDEDKDAMKKRFHSLVTAQGRTCKRCHTEEEESFVPFRKLGFSEQRINEVTNVNIVGIVDKYRDFFLPNLLNTTIDETNLQTNETETNEERNSLLNDELLKGRAWWRNAPSPEASAEHQLKQQPKQKTDQQP